MYVSDAARVFDPRAGPARGGAAPPQQQHRHAPPRPARTHRTTHAVRITYHLSQSHT